MNTKRLGYYLQSLAITAIVAGLLPVLLLALFLLLLTALQQFPPLASFSQAGSHQVMEVLTILGDGRAGQGILAIGATSSLVGMLFDTYAFCSHQGLAER